MISIVNDTIQTELAEMMGEEEFRDLLKEALVQFEQRIKELMHAIETKAWESARSLAHKIKGSMGSLGYDAIYVSLDALEARLLATPMNLPTQSDLEEIKSIIEETTKALKTS